VLFGVGAEEFGHVEVLTTMLAYLVGEGAARGDI